MNDDEDEYLFLGYFSPPVEFVYWRIGHHSMKYRQRRCVRRAHARYVDQRGPHAVARLGRVFASDLALPALPVQSCPSVGMGHTPLESLSLARPELTDRPRPYGRDVATRSLEAYYGPGALATHVFAWVAARASRQLATAPGEGSLAKHPPKLTCHQRRRPRDATLAAPRPAALRGYQPSVLKGSGRQVQVPRPLPQARPRGWRALVRALWQVGRWLVGCARRRWAA
jgi:hypothetical protein